MEDVVMGTVSASPGIQVTPTALSAAGNIVMGTISAMPDIRATATASASSAADDVVMGTVTTTPDIPITIALSGESTSLSTNMLTPSTDNDTTNPEVTAESLVLNTAADDPAWMVGAVKYLLAIGGQGKEWEVLVRNWLEIERVLNYLDGAVRV